MTWLIKGCVEKYHQELMFSFLLNSLIIPTIITIIIITVAFDRGPLFAVLE